MSGPAVAVALTSLVVLTASSFAAFQRLAIAKGLVAKPGLLVRAHIRPTPYLGGVALFAAVLPVLFVAGVGEPSVAGHGATARWIATACILGVGLYDDVRPMGVVPKLLAQAFVCAVYLIVAIPGSQGGVVVFALDLAMLIIVLNAFNVVDVMDGLLLIVAGVAAVGLLGGSFLMSPLDRFACVALLVALTVALRFNRPPARIFMGNAGALALGFFLGSLYLTGAASAPPASALAHLAVFAVPFFEVGLLVTARARHGRSPFRSSPDHFALRLQDQAGWSRWAVLGATAAIGLGLDVWVLVPIRHIGEPPVIALGGASIALALAAFLSCWRLAPPGDEPDALPLDLRTQSQYEPRHG